MPTKKSIIFIIGFLLAAFLAVSPTISMAQQEEPEEQTTTETAAADSVEVEQEESDEAAEEQQAATQAEPRQQEEQPSRRERRKKKKEDNDGGFLSGLAFWKNWGDPKTPTKPSQWHIDVKNYLGVAEDEYYRYGYTLIDDTWLGVFLVRRFIMMDKQYSHTMVIQGNPTRLPNIKGVRVGPLGLEVTNLGFDVQMPRFPSVARSAKRLDEVEAVQLASIQLELYGFAETEWLPDKRKDLREMADTWASPEKNLEPKRIPLERD